LDFYGVGRGGADLVGEDGDGGVFEADAGLEAEGLFEHGGGNFGFTVAVTDDAPGHHVGIAERVAVVDGKQIALLGKKHCVLTIIDKCCHPSTGNEITLFTDSHPLHGRGRSGCRR
jgi:hypothetical protein